jgi:hypothetical protein
MKIVIKEITPNGGTLLVYLMTETDQPISCKIIEKSKLSKTVETISNKEEEFTQVNYSYAQYIKQDERSN